MLYAAHSLRTSDGLILHLHQQAPSTQSPKAVLHIAHGMFEHGGRFKETMQALANQGFLCRAYDQRGHGRSEGKRGDTPSYTQLLSDIERFFDLGYQAHPDLPHFLLGHSMGGALVINFALRKRPPIQGIIASAPWLRLAFAPEAWKIHLGKLIAQIFPAFAQRTNMELSILTRDPVEIAAYTQDPLMHNQITARFFIEASRAGDWAMARAGNLRVPIYLYHGTTDYVTSLEASQNFAAATPQHLIDFEPLEGAYHDLFHDLDREAIIEKTARWMEQQLQNSKTYQAQA
ncbi:MAG: alpha/beta hydrolase [Bernardetiaceae bacterium]